MFEPVVTCPDDRPLERYGGKDNPTRGVDDGSKLLCSDGQKHCSKKVASSKSTLWEAKVVPVT